MRVRRGVSDIIYPFNNIAKLKNNIKTKDSEWFRQPPASITNDHSMMSVEDIKIDSKFTKERNLLVIGNNIRTLTPSDRDVLKLWYSCLDHILYA